ncbi:MAG: RNA polymerase sigma factor [Saprospiraceae bacterium]
MDLVLNMHQSERELISALVTRERWAQQRLYETHYSAMMNICLRYAGNESEGLDLLHDGFIKIFQHIHTYKTGTSLIAWMKRIMVNTCIDDYRKKNRRRTEDIDHVHAVIDNDPDVVSMLSANEILAVVQELSPAYRTVFNLYVIDGFAHQEIAQQLGINESTSRSNLAKARIKLQELLQKLSLNK